MVDLSNLELVQENIEVADDATYQDAREFPPLLPEGVYTFIQGKPEFKASKGFLQAEMKHTISGGDFDGKDFPFDRISNKPFERGGVKVSFMKDHLRAVGDRNTYREHKAYAEAMEAAEGKPFKAQVEWEGSCNHADTPQACDWADKDKVYRARGARAFLNGSGKPAETVPCPTCGNEVVARARISRRIAS